MPLTPYEEDELYKLIQDPTVDQRMKHDVMGVLEPGFKNLKPEDQAELLKRLQARPSAEPPSTAVPEKKALPFTVYSPAAPPSMQENIINAVERYGPTVGPLAKAIGLAALGPDTAIAAMLDKQAREHAQELIAPASNVLSALGIPGRFLSEKIIQGLEAAGADVKTPRPPFFSFPTRPMSIPPSAGEPPIPVASPSEQVEDIVNLALPFGGAVGVARFANKNLFRPRIPPVVEGGLSPEQEAMRQTILGERPHPGPLGPPAGRDVTTQITTDPLQLLSNLEKEGAYSFKALEKQYPPTAPAKPGTEPVHDYMRGRALGVPPESPGVSPGVTLPQIKGVEKAIKDANNLKSPLHEVDEAAENTIKQEPGKAPVVIPGAVTRMFTAGLDVLDIIGKAEPRALVLKDKLWDVLDNTERKTSQSMMNLLEHFERILKPSPEESGLRTWGEQKAARHFNPTKDFSFAQIFKATREEEKIIVDYLESYGTIPPTGPRAAILKEIGDTFYEKGTKGISQYVGDTGFTMAHPLFPGGKPYGSPNIFFPHSPLDPEKMLALNDLRARQLYAAAKAQGKDVGTYQEYKASLDKIARIRNEEIRVGTHSWVGKARGFNAADYGRPSDVLEALGYNTNILQTYFRFSSGGFRAAEGKLVEAEVNDLVTAIRARISESSNGRTDGSWLKTLSDRVLAVPPLDIVEREARGIISNLRHFNDATLLQLAALPQFNQITTIVGRAGFIDTLQASMRILRGETLKGTLPGKALDLAGVGALPHGTPERSGALFTVLLNELTHPANRWGELATGAMRASGFTSADAELRQFAAVVIGHHMDKLAKVLVAHPQQQKVRAAFESLRINPDEVIEAGGLTQAMREQAMQMGANLTQGRTDVRTLPLWATSDHPAAQLFYQYKKYLFFNASEFKRQLLEASEGATTPLGKAAAVAGRAAKLGAAAGVIGEVTRELQLALTNMTTDPFSIEGRKRVAPPLRWLYDQSPAAAYTIDRVAFGLGSAFGLLTYAALEPSIESMYQTAFGPTPGLAFTLAHQITKGVEGWIDDKKAPFKELLQTLVRRLPVVGPFGRHVIDELYEQPIPGRGVQPITPIRPLGP